MAVHIGTSEVDDGARAVKFQKHTPALSTPEHMKNTPRDTPGDEATVDFLQDLKVVSHRVASASVTDMGVLQALAATGKPIILSTVMSTLEQIDRAVEVLGTDNLVILQATSTYPLPAEEANLRTITTLKQRYPGAPVVYSGHERGLQSSIAAVALGAAEQTAESLPTAAVTVLASPVMPISEQLAVALKGTMGSIAAPPILDLSALAVRIAILKPDVVLLSVRGPLVRVMVRAIAHRAQVDLFVLHSRREVREFENLARSMGIDMPLGLATLPCARTRRCVCSDTAVDSSVSMSSS